MPILLPLSTLQIDTLKLTGYLLNLESPQGSSKAKYFLSYGFDPGDPTAFARALFNHARSSPLETSTVDRYGTSLVFRGKLACPNGMTTSDVRSVWQVAPDTQCGRLITAYPC